MVNYNYFVTAS